MPLPRTNMARELPAEITAIIVDHVRLDKPTLKICSLICKAWMNCAYRHLYAEKTFNAESVRNLLKSDSLIIPFVRRFSFNACHDTQFWDGTAWPLLFAFESIRSLSITSLRWSMHRMTAKGRSALHTQFAFINRLALSNSHFLKFSQVIEIVAGFPLLETFTINRVDWTLSDTPSAILCLPPNLRSLELRNCYRDVVFEWLLSLPRIPPLHTLCFDENPSTSRHTLEKVLQFLVPSLKEIFVDDPSYERDRSIDLSQHSSLRSIFLYLYVWTTPNSMAAMVKMLSGIGSTELERVVFDFGYAGIQPDFLPWNEVDAMLVRLEWPKLSRVEIRNFYSYYFPDRSRVLSLLPRCQERGILIVEDCPKAEPRPLYIHLL